MKPDQVNEGRGGDRRSIHKEESAVAESRKETTHGSKAPDRLLL